MSKPRWQRIDQLSQQEEKKLRALTTQTPGMTLYGHRARTAVMLPLHLAEFVSLYASKKEISIGQAIIELLESQKYVHLGP